MSIAVRIEPSTGRPPADVVYRWDADTDILCATVRGLQGPRADGTAGNGGGAVSERAAESVEVEGRDGSWIVLDVAGGGIAGVEVAVWPDLRRRAALTPPAEVEDAHVVLPPRGADGEAYEVTTAVAAEVDAGERTIHFTLGPRRPTRVVRVARDLLVDVDGRGRLAGLWLLNVPPAPQAA